MSWETVSLCFFHCCGRLYVKNDHEDAAYQAEIGRFTMPFTSREHALTHAIQRAIVEDILDPIELRGSLLKG